MIARPGNTLIHQAWRMKSRPSLNVNPQVGVDGSTPRPRKVRPDSARMPRPTANVACTMIGAIESLRTGCTTLVDDTALGGAIDRERIDAALQAYEDAGIRALVGFAMMDKPVAALQQSFLRTKTRDLKDFLRVANLQANSSNNTIFASRKGEIAYLHPPTRQSATRPANCARSISTRTN